MNPPQSTQGRVARGNFRHWALLGLGGLLTLLGVGAGRATPFGSDGGPMRESSYLTRGWQEAALGALAPACREKGPVQFSELTNLLAQASLQGNRAAGGWWGCALVMGGGSAADREKGLGLMRAAAGGGERVVARELGVLYSSDRWVPKDLQEAFKWFSKAAEEGDDRAELELGACYHYGLGTSRDWEQGLRWYRRAAEQTNYVAMKSLGYLYVRGLGVPRDLVQARFWSERAAREGHNRRAMFNLGAICLMSQPGAEGQAAALQWYRQSAEMGDALGCETMAQYYQLGWGGLETNQERSFQWRAKAAARGATDSQYRMGVACRTGEGGATNMTLFLAWTRKAALKHHPAALYELGVYYLQQSNAPSRLLAMDFMRQAAQGGHREAQWVYAWACLRGEGVVADEAAGRQWMERAAEAGWAKAEFVLFDCCFHGSGLTRGGPVYPPDRLQALRWLRRAAEHGSLRAQSTLAVMLLKGTDVERDPRQAEALLRSAAERGFAAAQNDLGFAMLHGDIATEGLLEAAMWCRLAQLGAPDTNTLRRAGVNYSNIVFRIGDQGQMEAEQRAGQFKPQPPVEENPLLPGWEEAADYQQEDGMYGH